MADQTAHAPAAGPWLVAGLLLVAVGLVFAAAVVVLVRHHRQPVDEHQAAEDLAYLRSLPSTPSVERAAAHRALATQSADLLQPAVEEETHAT
ncbi:MAG: hypothetical protein ABIQ18_23390 [Umezawaea sp.]